LRLNRYLASCGLGSRRKCEALITDCRVAVNGEVVFELGTVVDPRRDKVTFDGKAVRPPAAKTYILSNKPLGYLTTASDPHGRPTVMDLVPSRGARLFPAGRLDHDTTGLLLMTDDGALAFRLTHPRYGVEKKYVAVVEGRPTHTDLKALRKGVRLSDGPTRPAKVRLLSSGVKKCRVEIIIHEGRKRQVRRMFEAIGFRVLELERVAIAFLELGEMKPGACRRMKSAEVGRLRKLVGLYPLA
jgi:pseudouridine synthase